RSCGEYWIEPARGAMVESNYPVARMVVLQTRPEPMPPAAAVAAAPAPAAAPSARDLRLDLFRGIALWLIFLDHIPNNIVSWLTIRNYGFSDATEIFIFFLGYLDGFVYGRAMLQRGAIVSGARILRRAWQIYVAHIFLLAIYLAEI